MCGIGVDQHRSNQRAKTEANHLLCAETVNECTKENINYGGCNVPTAIINGEKAALDAESFGNCRKIYALVADSKA